MSEIKNIVKILRESIEKHPEIGELTDNIIIPDSEDDTLGFAIITKTDNVHWKRYRIMVEDNGGNKK